MNDKTNNLLVWIIVLLGALVFLEVIQVFIKYDDFLRLF